MDIFTLRELRKSKGKSLAQVAEKTGLSISTISKAETGHISISLKVADILSEYYGVKITPKKLVPTYEEYKPVGNKRERLYREALDKIKMLEDKIAHYEKKFIAIRNILS